MPSADKGTVLSDGTGQDTHIMKHPLNVSHYQSALSLCKALLVEATRVITSSTYFVNDVSQMVLILLITSFAEIMNKQAGTDTPDPGGEFIHSLLSNMETMNAKQKHFFSIVVTLFDEIFGNTESDG
jgi:hypothetical protein